MGIDINKKQLPIGKSFFDNVIECESYYVDKTLFIKDLIDKDAAVILCTRPHRFGKTLNLTMLKCFFEDTAQIGSKDTRSLFRGLKIEEAGERYMEHQGKHPVIFLSFKEAVKENINETYKVFKNIISEEFRRHSYVMEKIKYTVDLKGFENISSGHGDISLYYNSLEILSRCLENYHGKKSVVLIDDYDTPMQNAWTHGFYHEIIKFIYPLLGSVLKDNPHLEIAVMTGCLWVSTVGEFKGLNHLYVVSLLGYNYLEYFGFTQNEIDAMLRYYGMEDKTQIIKDWYNGYLFHETEMYNPWSSLHAVESWITDINQQPKPYWEKDTSDNDIIREMIDKKNLNPNISSEIKVRLETLLSGKTISTVVHEIITYDKIYNDADYLWNFLFFTGYLKKVGVGRMEGVKKVLDLSIPNLELLYIYETKIQDGFKEMVRQKDFDPLYRAILDGDAETVQKELGNFLLETICYLDAKEDFYHGVLLGVLAGMGEFTAKSNRETSLGLGDIVLRHTSDHGKAIIFELKCTHDMREIVKLCEEAVKQMKDGKYAKELETECYTDIIKYGIAFCKKSCEVRKG